MYIFDLRSAIENYQTRLLYYMKQVGYLQNKQNCQLILSQLRLLNQYRTSYINEEKVQLVTEFTELLRSYNCKSE